MPATVSRAGQIGMIAQQPLGHFLRDGRGFKGRQRLQQGELGGEFDQNADLARHLGDLRHRPGGGAADLPVVQPDVRHLSGRRELRDQGKDRHPHRL